MSNKILVWAIRGYRDEAQLPMHGEGETAREAVLWALGEYRIDDEVMEAAAWEPVRFTARLWLPDDTLGPEEEVILRASTVVYEVTKWEDQ